VYLKKKKSFCLGGRGSWISEFKASLVYRVSSRTARATQRNPVSRKKKKKKKKNSSDNIVQFTVGGSTNEGATALTPVKKNKKHNPWNSSVHYEGEASVGNCLELKFNKTWWLN
jgi:hypothetical protein